MLRKPQSNVVDIVIIDILLALARTPRKKQNVWFQESHVRITFNYSNLHDTTNFIIEIYKVEVHLPEWWVTLHLYAQQYNYKCRETVAHAMFSPTIR